jgi:hypothetical protein
MYALVYYNHQIQIIFYVCQSYAFRSMSNRSQECTAYLKLYVLSLS